MLQENILHAWPWILMVIGVLAIMLSLLGKISPKLAISIGLICGVFFLATNLLKNESSAASPFLEEKDTALAYAEKNTAGDSLMQNIPLDETSPENSERDSTFSPRPEASAPIERNYKIKDRKFWTYRTADNRVWTDKIKTDFFTASQWTYDKNGSYTIEVNHTGSFNKDHFNGAQRFIYGGGEVEIKVNEKVCCCQGSVQIPKGIQGKSHSDVEQQILTKMTQIITNNDKYIFERIINCLQ